MKVLMIAFGHPDNVLSLCANLSQQVDLTLVFVLAGKEQYQEGILQVKLQDQDYGLQEDPAYFQRTYPDSIVKFVGDNYRFLTLRLPSKKVRSLRNLRLFWSAISKLKKEPFDVVHYNGFSPYISLFYTRFKARAAQFWTLHDYINHSGEENERALRINRTIAKMKKLTVIQHYEYLRQQVIQTFHLAPEKVRTLLSGPMNVFHTFSPRYDLCPEEDFILFFGRIKKYKGVDLLLDAHQRMNGSKPKLVVAGKGDWWFDPTPYEEDPDILFHRTYIENESLIGLIQRAQFIVVPYRDATHSAVIATAYAFDKPVVASDVDGLKEVVIDQQSGRLVQPSSVDSLKDVMEELTQKPELLEHYRSQIHREKEEGKIAWKTIIDNYVALYAEKLLHRP